MKRRFVCLLCQRDYGTAERFYEHLFSHTREEVGLLKKLAEKELNLTEEEWEKMNWEIVKLSIQAEEEVRNNINREKTGKLS